MVEGVLLILLLAVAPLLVLLSFRKPALDEDADPANPCRSGCASCPISCSTSGAPRE